MWRMTTPEPVRLQSVTTRLFFPNRIRNRIVCDRGRRLFVSLGIRALTEFAFQHIKNLLRTLLRILTRIGFFILLLVEFDPSSRNFFVFFASGLKPFFRFGNSLLMKLRQRDTVLEFRHVDSRFSCTRTIIGMGTILKKQLAHFRSLCPNRIHQQRVAAQWKIVAQIHIAALG